MQFSQLCYSLQPNAPVAWSGGKKEAERILVFAFYGSGNPNRLENVGTN